MKQSRKIFAFLFPLLLFLLLFFVIAEMHSMLLREKRLEQQRSLQKRLQTIMSRIQTNFSLNLQIENHFSKIVEKLSSSPSSADVKTDVFAGLYSDGLPEDLKRNCRLWFFSGTSERFAAAENAIFCSNKTGLMARAFTSLVKLARPDVTESEIGQHSRFLAGVFGENSAPWYLASERRGRLTPVIFEKHQHYLYWEKFGGANGCTSGFMAIFPGGLIENDRHALFRLASMISRENKDLFPVFICSKNLNRLYPPVLCRQAEQVVEVWQAARIGINRFYRNIASLKPRTLQSINDSWFYYDSIADETPYFALLFLRKHGEESDRGFMLPGILVGIIYLWSAFFWLRLADGGFKLEFAFRLLFFMTAMLPVLLLAFFGVRLIDQLHEANIRTRVQEGFARLELINKKSEDMISISSRLVEERFNDNQLHDLLLSESQNENRQGFDLLAAKLRQIDVSLGYLLLMRPGRHSQYFADSYRNSLLARHHLDYSSASCYSMHSKLTSEFPDARQLLLSSGQKVIFDSFKRSDRQMSALFRESLQTPGYFGESASENLLNYSFVVGREDWPVAYITLGFNLDAAAIRLLIKEFSDVSISADDLYIGLHDINGGRKILIDDADRRIISSEKGRCFLDFIKSSSIYKYQLEVRNENEIFIYEPLMKMQSMSAGAMLGIVDIRKNRELKLMWLAILLSILTGMIYLLAAWVSETMIEPTRELSAVFSDISAGNFSRTFSYSYGNELGILADATNLMGIGLRQRQILGKFVSRTFDQDVMTGSDRTEAQELYGVILFSDIRSFTTISESHPPEITSQMLNNHLQAMVTEIQNCKGQIEQFIGDAIVAFFPGSDSRVCLNAIEAAAAMIEKHRAIIAERASRALFSYEIGIGLEYGLVMAGTLKSGSRSEFSVVGPARTRAEEYEGASKTARFTRIIVGEALIKNLVGSPYIFCRHADSCYELQSLEKSA